MIENMMLITADRKLHSCTLQYYYVLSLILRHSKSAVVPISDTAQMYNKEELFFYICFIPSVNIKSQGY